MWVEDVLRPEAEALGLIAPGQQIAAPETVLYQTLTTGLVGLGERERRQLQNAFGDQVSIKSDTAQ